MATLQDQYNLRKQESANQINNLYDKQLAATNQGLKATYDQNLSNATAARDKLAPQYQTQANSLAAAYQRNRRNANLAAMTSGLANGTQQQVQNAMRNQYTANYGALRGEQAGAITEANRNIANLQQTYQNNLAQAQLENENKRAAELIKDQNTQQEWYANQAKNLANYGDFSGYASLYGQQTADAMRNVWIAQNPELAYRTGAITAAKYKQMTGKNPI